MYIDTHLHLSKNDYENLDEVVLSAQKNKVETLIVSGCDSVSIQECLAYYDRYLKVYYTFGYHPSEVEKVIRKDLDNLKKSIQTYSKVVGIGEIGLDYHYGKETREQQMILFEEQLKLAQELHLPVVIHSRDATEDTIHILKKYPVTGIIHCFSGSVETANIYIEMGYKLGIGGVVTFSNSKLKDVVKAVPLTALVLETDSPYLAPVPVRGTQNAPVNIPYIAKKIAEIKECSLEEVASITTKTAIEVFDLPRE